MKYDKMRRNSFGEFQKMTLLDVFKSGRDAGDIKRIYKEPTS